ncbi:LOW QUALITY PROTEIN: AP-5 complex subunit mu-1 [Phaethornis superciliosus]
MAIISMLESIKQVLCNIEGSAPNLTLSLNLLTDGPQLQDTVIHHFVTSVDPAMLMSSSDDPLDDSVCSEPYKFPLIPPSDFNLCYYTIKVPVTSVLECYQALKEESQLKITNLKLHESIMNSFENCEAHTPFYNRAQITQLEYRDSYGQLDLSEKCLLVWVMGQKFPTSLEFSLTGLVSFGTAGQEVPADDVCIGNAAKRFDDCHFGVCLPIKST